MDNNFGKLLKNLISESGSKANIVSEKLGYDPTYLSKWITGNKLPSEKNIDSICEKLSVILGGDESSKKIESDLLSAYYSDLEFSTLESNMDKNISVVTSETEITDLILKVIQQLEYSGIKNITINTTMNFFQEFEYQMDQIISKLHEMKPDTLELNICASFENYDYNPLIFCNNILSLTSGDYFIDFNIYKSKNEVPKILIINNAIAMNIVHLKNVVFLCYYSFDEEYIKDVKNSYKLIQPHMEKTLSYVVPISFRKTNVQLNQLTQNELCILFSESPAFLIPKDIINYLIGHKKPDIEGIEWDEHINYLIQVSNTFEKYTRHNNVRVLIYESMLLQYISSGIIEIGGHKHKFTKEQITEHILYICECMRKNSNIEFYIISDTIDFNVCRHQNTPSIFLSPSSIAVANTNIYTFEQSCNYYYSTERSIIRMFEMYIQTITEKSSCEKISSDRLATYVE
jgi:transcriptional regulator with XRE-family HTH domain